MYGYGEWAPYVPVAERRRLAVLALEKRRRDGHPVSPVTITGRAIATTVWGRAWCDNLESYRDYANRLERGKTYVRNGSVVDLQIAAGKVTAAVSGSDLYDVAITIKPTAPSLWKTMCAACAGGIDSLVELLKGTFSKGVMERLCRQEDGLFPRPSDIRFSCTCPDHAEMCKHVAAVCYGVGARLDQAPDLLFRLRAVDPAELVSGIDAALPLGKQGPAAGRVLESDDLSSMFGLDMAEDFSARSPVPPIGKVRAVKTAPGKTILAKTIPVTPRQEKPPAAKARTSKEGAGKAITGKVVAAQAHPANAKTIKPREKTPKAVGGAASGKSANPATAKIPKPEPVWQQSWGNPALAKNSRSTPVSARIPGKPRGRAARA